MKKTLLFLTCVFAFSLLQAQWVNDPVNNTKLIALSSGIIPNIQLCTNEATGDTYVMAYGSNQINLQRINVNGVNKASTLNAKSLNKFMVLELLLQSTMP